MIACAWPIYPRSVRPVALVPLFRVLAGGRVPSGWPFLLPGKGKEKDTRISSGICSVKKKP